MKTIYINDEPTKYSLSFSGTIINTLTNRTLRNPTLCHESTIYSVWANGEIRLKGTITVVGRLPVYEDEVVF